MLKGSERRPIVSRPRHPYYVVAPPYVRTSAGIKALHLLCHALNRVEQRAYLCIYPTYGGQNFRSADLLTPLLDADIVQQDFERGLTPIAVYAETTIGNPLNAPLVARYVMNFPGLLGGTAEFQADELCFAYSSVLADAVGAADKVLFIPASDPEVFKPEPHVQRRGSCFFAGKYKYVLGGALSPLTEGSVEITRGKPDSPNPQQIADLFRSSEFFYCYENSALAIEAVLCECPVVFIPNKYLTAPIASKELGPEGYAWGTDVSEMQRAKDTVRQGRINYLNTFERFWEQLDRFISLTQSIAASAPYGQRIDVRRINREPLGDVIARYVRASAFVVQHQGWSEFARRAARRVARPL